MAVGQLPAATLHLLAQVILLLFIARAISKTGPRKAFTIRVTMGILTTLTTRKSLVVA